MSDNEEGKRLREALDKIDTSSLRGKIDSEVSAQTTSDEEVVEQFDDDNKRYNNLHKQEILRSFRQDNILRKEFADKIFRLICCWLLFVGFLTLLNGFHDAIFPFKPITLYKSAFQLPENVLITLLATTTATIIGLFNFVAKYLFSTSGESKRKPR